MEAIPTDWLRTGVQILLRPGQRADDCLLGGLFVAHCGWALSGVFPSVLPVLRVLAYGKGIFFDIPVFVFFFLMTRHAKTGGVTWKWEVPR